MTKVDDSFDQNANYEERNPPMLIMEEYAAMTVVRLDGRRLQLLSVGPHGQKKYLNRNRARWSYGMGAWRDCLAQTSRRKLKFEIFGRYDFYTRGRTKSVARFEISRQLRLVSCTETFASGRLRACTGRR